MKLIFNRLTQFISVVAIISGLLLYSSCKKEAGPIIVLPANPPKISFANEIQPIFTPKCASAGCHKGGTPAGNLNLEAGNSYTNLVNVPANYGTAILVVPSVAGSSVLWHKVADTGIYGGVMPMAGPLQSFEQDLIKKWINEGALNN